MPRVDISVSACDLEGMSSFLFATARDGKYSGAISPTTNTVYLDAKKLVQFPPPVREANQTY